MLLRSRTTRLQLRSFIPHRKRTLAVAAVGAMRRLISEEEEGAMSAGAAGVTGVEAGAVTEVAVVGITTKTG